MSGFFKKKIKSWFLSLLSFLGIRRFKTNNSENDSDSNGVIMYMTLNHKMSDFDSNFIELLNSYRSSLGLFPLKKSNNQKVIDICYHHVLYMKKHEKASHDFQFSRHEYINQIHGGKQIDNRECCAENYSSESSYLNGFKKSKKHNSALLHPDMNHVCVCSSDDKEYIIVFLYRIR